jgi:hypothetical protein
LPIIVKIRDVIAHGIPAVMPEMSCAAFGKCSVAVVDIIVVVLMKIVPYIDIFPAIVIEITYCNPQPISQAALIDACLRRDIRELRLPT